MLTRLCDQGAKIVSIKLSKDALNLKTEGPKFNQLIYALLISAVSNCIKEAQVAFEWLCYRSKAKIVSPKCGKNATSFKTYMGREGR